MQESICFPHIISERSSLTHWQWENFLNTSKRRKSAYWFLVQMIFKVFCWLSKDLFWELMTSELFNFHDSCFYFYLTWKSIAFWCRTSGHFTKNNKLSFVLTNSMVVPAFCHGTCKWTSSVITTTTWRVLPTKTYLNLWNKRFSCYWAMTHYWNADQWANLGNMCLIAQDFG